MKTVILTRGPSYNVPGFGALELGENKVSEEMLSFMASNRTICRAINAGILQIGHGSDEPAPVAEVVAPSDDLEALRELAAGDGRRKDVQEARAKLAELEAEE
jgi:hypothetical protein